MFSIKNFKPRAYQENISKTCIKKNTLVVLPTGVGKTAISLMVAIDRLNNIPSSKVLICSPTKPLCQQHVNTFIEHTTIPSSRIIIYTGAMQPKVRKKFWDVGLIIIATPQTIQSDVENSRISLDDVSLLVIDEAHRSRMKFANTVIAKAYMESQCKTKHILALTASPGHTKEKINEICTNLFIDDVEVRTDQDDDVKNYIQSREYDLIEVELPDNIKKIHKLLHDVYVEKVKKLSRVGFRKPASVTSKKDLLAVQIRLRQEIIKKNASAFYGISVVAQALKVDYAMELLETQGIEQALNYLNQLKDESSKAAKAVCDDKAILEAISILQSLTKAGVVHPKMIVFKNLLSEQFLQNPNSKTIVFANYRSTVDSLVKIAESVNGARPVKLMGQKEGITQKQQINTIKQLESGKYNVIVATSIGEEGLSIEGLDLAMFYDHVASAVRRIQRAGRVARIKPGRIVYIVTKNTRDSAFFWKSRKDEKTMSTVLQDIKKSLKDNTLEKF